MTEHLPPAGGSATQGVRAVLSIRPFRRLWIALSLSSLGDWLGLLAMTSLAPHLVHGYSTRLYAIGGVLFVRLLPAVVIGPFAGAFADRLDRRTTMVVADTIRCLLFVSIPIVRNLWWLLAASFLVESAALFWIPAKEASVPNLVPGERLESANQVSLIATYGSAAVASVVFALLALVNSALAGIFPFFRSNSVDLALYFDAATFLFSAFTVLRLPQITRAVRRITDASEPPGAANLVRTISEGWRFVVGTPWLRGVVVGLLGGFFAAGTVVALSRPFVDDLRAGNAGYAAMFGTLFVGLATGMFLGPRLLVGFSRRRLMGLAIVAGGLSLSVDALMPNLPLAILWTLLVGVFAGIAWVEGLTVVGLGVADEIRGRTFSFLYSVMQIDLLAVLAAAPFISGLIGRHSLHLRHVRIRLDGVTLTLLGAGVLAAAVGIVCYRLLDDRRGISIWHELLASVRHQLPVRAHSSTAGYLVAFEGGDGAGKSTQVALAAAWLRSCGHEVVVTREPGATPLGEQLRRLLLERGRAPVSPRAEAMLYGADRAQHVAQVILPALQRGAVVVTDRYVDSTLAYQGGGRTLPAPELEQLARFATAGLVPDLTVVLDVPPDVARSRMDGPADRLEAEPDEFRSRVRQAFLALAERDAGRYLVVDATGTPEAVHALVRDRLAQAVPAKEPADGALPTAVLAVPSES